MTSHQYLLRVRLRRAAKLLARGGMLVTEAVTVALVPLDGDEFAEREPRQVLPGRFVVRLSSLRRIDPG